MQLRETLDELGPLEQLECNLGRLLHHMHPYAPDDGHPADRERRLRFVERFALTFT
jgi:hypothetical protein